MEKPIFSVLTYNIGGYEDFYELDKSVMNKDAEYIYITDNKSITSNTWTVCYVDFDPNIKTPIEVAFEIRFFPFFYVNSDIVISLDGSMRIKKDLTPIIEKFNEGNYDAGVFVHNERDNIYDEYQIWKENGYTYAELVDKDLEFFNKENYDLKNHKGLYVAAFFIQRNNEFNNVWNLMSYSICKYLGMDTVFKIERIDQCIRSFVLNKYFPDKKILPLSIDLTKGNFLSWMNHRSGTERILEQKIDYYVQNKKVIPYGANGIV